MKKYIFILFLLYFKAFSQKKALELFKIHNDSIFYSNIYFHSNYNDIIIEYKILDSIFRSQPNCSVKQKIKYYKNGFYQGKETIFYKKNKIIKYNSSSSTFNKVKRFIKYIPEIPNRLDNLFTKKQEKETIKYIINYVKDSLDQNTIEINSNYRSEQYQYNSDNLIDKINIKYKNQDLRFDCGITPIMWHGKYNQDGLLLNEETIWDNNQKEQSKHYYDFNRKKLLKSINYNPFLNKDTITKNYNYHNNILKKITTHKNEKKLEVIKYFWTIE